MVYVSDRLYGEYRECISTWKGINDFRQCRKITIQNISITYLALVGQI